MSRRIEIEVTSAQPDGSWTWRAAGAREPRGVLDGGLLPEGTKAGAILRAEAEFEIDGITIVAVLAPKESTRADSERIEIIGPGRPEGPGVTTQLFGRSDRRPGDRRRDRDEGRPRRDRDPARPQNARDSRDGRRPRREGRRPDDGGAADGAPTTEGPAEAKGQDTGSAEGAERERSDRPSRSGRTERTDRTPTSRSERPGTRASRSRASGDGTRTDAAGATPRPADRPGRRRDGREGRSPELAGGTERRARRFSPGRAHRQAVMASLPPEQQPIAEQVLRGGIPAVRTALHLEREKAVAEGRPAPNTDQLIAMAESLLPRLKAAEWRDRAEAAAKDVEEISLRDLRSVVAGADVARDDESRALAAGLREALDGRVDRLRQEWTGEIAKHLDENRVVRALRLAARPPEPSARMESGLTQRLSDAAGEAMASDTPPDRWLALIDAVAASPVRRSVKPAGLPAEPTPELRRAAHQQSGRIPALASMLGVAIPPPPAPAPGRRSGAVSRGPRPAGGPGDGGTDADTVGAGEAETGGAGEAETGGAGEAETGGAGEAETGGAGETETGGAGETETVGTSDGETVGTSDGETVGTSDAKTVGTGDAETPGREAGDGEAVGSAGGGEDAVLMEELGEPVNER